MGQIRKYDSIDLLKFISCIMVVAIHSDPLQEISPLTNRLISAGICRLAVPLFFIASSFFLFKKGSLTTQSVKNYIRRISYLYALWFIISLPITIFNSFIVGDSAFSVKVFQFVKSFFFTSTFSGSWFLMSSVFCTILYYILQNIGKRSEIVIPILSLLIYLICVSTSAYGRFMDVLGIRDYYNLMVFYFAKPYTSILVGVPYFAIGKYLANNEAENKKPNLAITTILLVLLLIEIYVTYTYKLTNSTDCYFMLLPCAYCIFVTFLHLNVSIPNASTLRKYSTLVFFSQFIWLFVIEFVEWGGQLKIPQIVKFIAGLALCMITAWSVVKLSDKYKILKYLY